MTGIRSHEYCPYCTRWTLTKSGPNGTVLLAKHFMLPKKSMNGEKIRCPCQYPAPHNQTQKVEK